MADRVRNITRVATNLLILGLIAYGALWVVGVTVQSVLGAFGWEATVGQGMAFGVVWFGHVCVVASVAAACCYAVSAQERQKMQEHVDSFVAALRKDQERQARQPDRRRMN